MKLILRTRSEPPLRPGCRQPRKLAEIGILSLMPDFGSRWEWVADFREGGQAHTFKVKDKSASDGKIYILKRLKNSKRGDRFDREIQACRSLEHPNVLKIEDNGVLPGKDGKSFFVSEYCERGSLEDQEMLLGSLVETVELFRQICAGVAYAHGKGIVHRDIKPENILLGTDGTPVVGDFGICFIDADDNGQRLTATMEVAGSRWYSAPELRDGRLESGVSQAPADVYSLGKVLYWMLSGKRIFDREDFRQQKYRIGQDDPTEPAYELINQLFDKAIVVRPNLRIQNATALLSEVDQLLSVMRAGGHAISLEVRHRCIFCAQGEYKVVVNGLEGNAQAASSEAQSMLGWQVPGPYPAWLIMVCQACGNIQAFRPDLPPAGSSGFVNQQANARKQRWLAKRNP
jgi:serine/threonine protein kinase